jgi:predicted RNase H-like HicB family nuclease
MKHTANLKLNVLLENKEDGIISASALEFPAYKVEAASRQEAFEALQQLLDSHLKKAEIVPLEIEVSYAQPSENPWVRFAGIFKDDPYFKEIADAIRAERESDDDSEVDPSLYT